MFLKLYLEGLYGYIGQQYATGDISSSLFMNIKQSSWPLAG